MPNRFKPKHSSEYVANERAIEKLQNTILTSIDQSVTDRAASELRERIKKRNSIW